MPNKIPKLTRLKISRKIFKKLPEEPGVYLFFKKNTPIYIGKAVNLKNRISSYFAASLTPKTSKMVSEATTLSFIKVVNELDSLLLEAKLIHDLKPQYNSTLKDDKHPLYIAITDEKFPRVISCRKLSVISYKHFFGPFPSSSTVRSVLRMLRRIFPYAEHKIGNRPCLYSHIGLCDPCPNEIEKLEDGGRKVEARRRYLRNVKNIVKVLERKINVVIKDLSKKMEDYSKAQDFEKAAEVRDQMKRLEYISQPILPTEGFLENPNLVEDLRNEEQEDLSRILKSYLPHLTSIRRIECFDIAHLAGTSPTASMVTFTGGEADKAFYRHFKIKQRKGVDDVSSMAEIALRRAKNFDKWGKPDLIIVDGGKGQVGAFQKALSGKKVPVIGLAKQFETLVIPQKDGSFNQVRLKDSPALFLVQRIRNEAHRFARRYHHHLLKKYLLPNKNAKHEAI